MKIKKLLGTIICIAAFTSSFAVAMMDESEPEVRNLVGMGFSLAETQSDLKMIREKILDALKEKGRSEDDVILLRRTIVDPAFGFYSDLLEEDLFRPKEKEMVSPEDFKEGLGEFVSGSFGQAKTQNDLKRIRRRVLWSIKETTPDRQEFDKKKNDIVEPLFDLELRYLQPWPDHLE